MKNLLIRTRRMMALLLTFCLTSCCFEDAEPENTFTFGAHRITVDEGVFFYSTQPQTGTDGEDYYEHQLVLATEELMYTSPGNMSGRGSVIVLNILGATSSLQEGVYMLDPESGPKAGDLSSGVLIPYFDESLPGDAYAVDFQTVSISILKSGGGYKIRLSGSLASGDYISGRYAGRLETEPVNP